MGFSNKVTVLVLRLTLGAILFAHGLLKLGVLSGGEAEVAATLAAGEQLGQAAIYRVAVTTLESLGGLLLMLGMFGRFVSLAVVALLGFRLFMVHPPYFFAADGGFEYTLALLAMGVALLFSGMGPISVDGLFADWRRKGKLLKSGSGSSSPSPSPSPTPTPTSGQDTPV